MLPTKAIGIDLGISNSCVGVFHNGAIEILANDIALRTTPYVVAFTDGEITVGQQSKDELPEFPLNVISCIKRLIGRRFDDPKVQKDMKTLPFKIVSKRRNAAIEVEFKGERKIYTPEQISAYILLEMKKIAIQFLGGEMSETVGAVITVPAYFDNSQREATIDAAKIAGLNVLRIINEPTAAALAYGYKAKWKEGILLVYDLGGGTFDVSLIKITNGCCEVIGVAGDNHLGGEDFDKILVKYCVKEFKKLYPNDDVSKNAKAMGLLKAKCEQTKIYLCGECKNNIRISNFYENRELFVVLEKEVIFERFQKLVDKTLVHVKNILEKNGIAKSDVNDVVLIGGSSRISLVSSSLSKFFDGKSMKCDINADEAVAYGASLMAAHLNNSYDNSIRNIRLLDVIPRSLGVDLYKHRDDKTGYMEVVAKRGSKFPLQMTTRCTTLFTNQEEMDFVVYEGEDTVPEKNKKLGHFTLTNIAPAREGVPRIEITFKVNKNAILTVSAVDKRNGNSEFIKIRPDKGRLTDDEIVQMIYDIQFPGVITID